MGSREAHRAWIAGNSDLHIAKGRRVEGETDPGISRLQVTGWTIFLGAFDICNLRARLRYLIGGRSEKFPLITSSLNGMSSSVGELE